MRSANQSLLNAHRLRNLKDCGMESDEQAGSEPAEASKEQTYNECERCGQKCLVSSLAKSGNMFGIHGVLCHSCFLVEVNKALPRMSAEIEMKYMNVSTSPAMDNSQPNTVATTRRGLPSRGGVCPGTQHVTIHPDQPLGTASAGIPEALRRSGPMSDAEFAEVLRWNTEGLKREAQLARTPAEKQLADAKYLASGAAWTVMLFRNAMRKRTDWCTASDSTVSK